MSKVDAIRWAIGSPQDLRSSPWRVWGNKKGDIYVSVRALGGITKVSLHRDGRCQHGFTSDYFPIARARFGTKSRHSDTWILPAIPPPAEVLQILVPQSELRSFTERHDDDLNWLATPPVGSVGVITIFLAPAKHTMLTPKNAELVGSIQTSIRSAWIFYTRHPIDPVLEQTISLERAKLEGMPRPSIVHLGTRAILLDTRPDHTRHALELAFDPSPQSRPGLFRRALKKILDIIRQMRT